MNKFLSAVAVAAAVSAISLLTPDPAYAKSDKEAKAQLQECKKIADPKQRDECVSNAQNRLEKGKGAAKKEKASGEKAMKKAKGKEK